MFTHSDAGWSEAEKTEQRNVGVGLRERVVSLTNLVLPKG